MPADIRIVGAEKLHILARGLRQIGDKDLSHEFYAGLNRTVKPLTASVKASTPQFLPARYATVLAADLRVRPRRRTGGRNPAIYLMGTAKKRDIRSLNRGRLRHPLYGNRGHWYDQQIKPRWWDEPLLAEALLVRRELMRVLDEMAVKVARRI